MKPEFLQNISNILIFIGIICTGLGGFSAYYFGKKSDKQKEERSETNYSIQTAKIDSLLKGNEELKNQLSPFLVQARKLYPNETDSTALQKLRRDIEETRAELNKEKNTINNFSSNLSVRFKGRWKEAPFPQQLLSPVDHEWLILFQNSKSEVPEIKLFTTEIYNFSLVSENVAVFNSHQGVKYGAFPVGNPIQSLDRYDKLTFFIPLVLYNNLQSTEIIIEKIDLTLVLNGKIVKKMVYNHVISAEAAIYNNHKAQAWVVFSISRPGQSIMSLFS